MGKKSFAILFVAVVAIFASYNIYQSQRAVHLSDLALANVEMLAYGEMLPEVDITCDSGSSGRCFKMGYQNGLYGVCYFYCNPTGYQSDYCSSFYVGLVNFCTAIGGYRHQKS
ncbi:NVEALA domain-containing protein [Bacteroides neonati]|uniref:NVEALA domain-containing protein n=1 Tax=Bacteroides neonati TaxID=1347393 RepID=UPI0009436CD2